MSTPTRAAAVPSVAVVIPAHNAARWITACLEAVAGQRVAPAEIVVVDDGSTDETRARVTAWQQAHPAPPVALLTHASAQGPSAARNTGWQHASAPWIAFCDADDVWHPQHLAHLLHAADTQAADVVCSTLVEFSEAPAFPAAMATIDHAVAEKVIEAPLLALFRGNFVPQSGVLVRRAMLASADGYEAARWLCEDYDLWGRLARTARFVQVDWPSLARRRHDAQVSHRRRRAFEAARWDVRRDLRRMAGVAADAESPARLAEWRAAEAAVAAQELDECWRGRDADLFAAALRETAAWPGATAVRQAWERRRLLYWPFRALQWAYDRMPPAVHAWRRARAQAGGAR